MEDQARVKALLRKVLELLRRKQGATLAEIMKATGWQAHSVGPSIVSGLKKGRIGEDFDDPPL
ncbi:MAG: DUF3489 domain-containing protein [Terriglobia bacterium]